MRDFTAGHIPSEDGRPLIEAIQAALGGTVPGGRLEFYPGVSYRNILVYRATAAAPFAVETRTQPPHDVPDQPIAEYMPRGPGSELLRDLMETQQGSAERASGQQGPAGGGQTSGHPDMVMGPGPGAAAAAICRGLRIAGRHY